MKSSRAARKRPSRTKKAKEKLQEQMDVELEANQETLHALKKMKDFDGLWQTLSACVEHAWLRHLDGERAPRRKSRKRRSQSL